MPITIIAKPTLQNLKYVIYNHKKLQLEKCKNHLLCKKITGFFFKLSNIDIVISPRIQYWLGHNLCFMFRLCLSLLLQRSSRLHRCKCQKRFCCACWSTPTSSRSWNTMRRTSGRQSTTSSTGTSPWIISSSYCRCVDTMSYKVMSNIGPTTGLVCVWSDL